METFNVSLWLLLSKKPKSNIISEEAAYKKKIRRFHSNAWQELVCIWICQSNNWFVEWEILCARIAYRYTFVSLVGKRFLLSPHSICIRSSTEAAELRLMRFNSHHWRWVGNEHGWSKCMHPSLSGRWFLPKPKQNCETLYEIISIW